MVPGGHRRRAGPRGEGVPAAPWTRREARGASGQRAQSGMPAPWSPQNPGRAPEPDRDANATPWRPWILTSQEAELTRTGSPLETGGDPQTPGSKGAFGFQHPVRLYLPISKRQEYLQSSGEKVLASFPVQATIHFYNDESDSDDDEQEAENQTSHLQRRETQGLAENSPGGKGRGQPTNPGWSSVGHSGLGGKGPLPHGDPLEGTDPASPK
ncbi:protein ripply3 [Neovison vison]|uniref:protein ripply3 n=1 Tax=Neovison vison TaxID=452646 RepID=UPI001CEFFA75|nr:protein ripply3 [Neogale vison]